MRKLRINQRGAGAGLALFTAIWRDVYSKCHMVFAMPLSWFYTRGYNVDVVLLFQKDQSNLARQMEGFLEALVLFRVSIW